MAKTPRAVQRANASAPGRKGTGSKFLLASAAAAILLACGESEPVPPSARLVMAREFESVLDGVAPGQRIPLPVVNQGSDVITISAIVTSCGCAVAHMGSTPVQLQPGATLEAELALSVESQSWRAFSVTVISVELEPFRLTLRARGRRSSWTPTQASLDLPSVLVGVPHEFVLGVEASDPSRTATSRDSAASIGRWSSTDSSLSVMAQEADDESGPRRAVRCHVNLIATRPGPGAASIRWTAHGEETVIPVRWIASSPLGLQTHVVVLERDSRGAYERNVELVPAVGVGLLAAQPEGPGSDPVAAVLDAESRRLTLAAPAEWERAMCDVGVRFSLETRPGLVFSVRLQVVGEFE